MHMMCILNSVCCLRALGRMKAERSRRSDWHDQHEGLVWRGHWLCYTCGFHPECFTKPYLKKEGATPIHWIEDEIESCAQAVN